MQRRHLLTLGIGSSAILAIGGATVALWRPGLSGKQLSAAGSAVMRAVASAVLDGLLPTEPGPRRMAIESHMLRLEAAIAAFPAPTRSELSDLLAVLATPAGRWGLARLSAPWEQASVPQVQAALQSMRDADTLTLRQQAYHALRKVTAAAYFADQSTWPALGYPGPIPV